MMGGFSGRCMHVHARVANMRAACRKILLLTRCSLRIVEKGLSYYVLNTLPGVYISKGKIKPFRREELMEARRVCKGVSSLTLLYVSSQCVDDTALVQPSIFQAYFNSYLELGVECFIVQNRL